MLKDRPNILGMFVKDWAYVFQDLLKYSKTFWADINFTKIVSC